MSKGGGGGTTTTVSTPWSGAIPYMNGGGGYMPNAQNTFYSSGWNGAMQGASNQMAGGLQGQLNSTLPAMQNTGNAIMSGALNPNIHAVSQISGPSMIDSNSAFGALGGSNPSGALSNLLSGTPSQTQLNGIGNEANAMYGQATQNLMQQIMPQIDSGAVASGGYGGSRQGIAQGLAISNMEQNLAPSIANLYNSANSQAAQNQNSTANNLAGIGTNMAETNAGNQLSTQQINANLGLSNNQQALAANQASVNNILQGSNLAANAMNLTNNNNQSLLNLAQAPQNYNWQNLRNYAGVINPGASLGGSTSQPYFTNPGANMLGGALGGAALGSALGIGSGWGAGAGALLALSDRRFKTDIARVGKLDNGLNVYSYRYKFGGPQQIGVMADEVKQVNPSAVVNIDGVDFVNYGSL